jgi:anti-anti-sigma factor
MSVHDALTAGEFSVVRLPEEIDLANSSEVQAGLLAAIAEGGSQLVVDARDVRFMDSSGLHALLRARERTLAMHGSFHLVAASPRVQRLLEISGLDGHLRRVDTVEEAVACVTSASQLHRCGRQRTPGPQRSPT